MVIEVLESDKPVAQESAMSESDPLREHVDQRHCPKCDNWHAIASAIEETAIRPLVLTVDGDAAVPPSRSVPTHRLLV